MFAELHQSSGVYPLNSGVEKKQVSVLGFFSWGLTAGNFLFGGYIAVTWYESQMSLKNLCNKHKHIKFKLVKNVKLRCNTLCILWIFNICPKSGFLTLSGNYFNRCTLYSHITSFGIGVG